MVKDKTLLKDKYGHVIFEIKGQANAFDFDKKFKMINWFGLKDIIGKHKYEIEYLDYKNETVGIKKYFALNDLDSYCSLDRFIAAKFLFS